MNKPGLLFMALRPTNQLVKYSLLFRTLVCSALYVDYLGVNTVYSSGTLGGINWWCHRVQRGRKKTKWHYRTCTTKRTARARGTQIPAARSLGLLDIARCRPYYRVLCREFASRHPPSAYNFDVNHRFLKNLWAPASDFSYSTEDKLYSCKSLPNSDTNDVSVKMQHHLL